MEITRSRKSNLYINRRYKITSQVLLPLSLHTKVYSNIERQCKLFNLLNSSQDQYKKIPVLKEFVANDKEMEDEREFGYRWVYKKARVAEMRERSKEFFKCISHLSNDDKSILVNDFDTVHALFLTYVAGDLIPSCEMSDVIWDIFKRCDLFNGYTAIRFNEDKRPESLHVFDPEKMLKLVKKHTDIFGNINCLEEVRYYFENNPIDFDSAPYERYPDAINYYLTQMRTGICMGFPRRTVEQFALLQRIAGEYKGSLKIVPHPKHEEEIKNRERDCEDLLQYKDDYQINIHDEVLRVFAGMSESRISVKYAHYTYDFNPASNFHKRLLMNVTKQTKFYDRLLEIAAKLDNPNTEEAINRIKDMKTTVSENGTVREDVFEYDNELY